MANLRFIAADKLVASIEAQLKKIQRRRLFEEATRSSSGSATSSSHAQAPSASKDHPLFTLKQVTLICKRMLQEREEQLREEYDKVVASKLAGGRANRRATHCAKPVYGGKGMSLGLAKGDGVVDLTVVG